MTNILEINELRKEYNGFTLNNISFVLKSGYIMGLIGPNGAGKTTTIRLIMNLLQRTSGNIRVFGRDNRDSEVPIKQRIGFVFICQVEDKDPVPAPKEVMDIQWVKKKELRRILEETPEKLFVYQLGTLDYYLNYG